MALKVTFLFTTKKFSVTCFSYENKKLTRDITLKIVNLFRIKVRKIRYAQIDYTLKLYTL